MFKLIRLTAVEPLDDYWIRVTVEDGTVRDIDIKPYLDLGPIFEPVRNPGEFAQVHIVSGAVTWPCGADIDTYVLLGERESSNSTLAKRLREQRAAEQGEEES